MATTLVKVISSEIDSRVRRLIKFLGLGKSNVQTAYESMPFGIDGTPVKDMIAIHAETADKGKTVIVGYINKNQISAPGELRLFCTDENGEEKFYTWLKRNGTYEIGGNVDWMVRYSKLEEGFNELRSDFNKLVQNYNVHQHTCASPGSLTTPGTPAAAGVQSTASIGAAKINEIRTL